MARSFQLCPFRIAIFAGQDKRRIHLLEKSYCKTKFVVAENCVTQLVNKHGSPFICSEVMDRGIFIYEGF